MDNDQNLLILTIYIIGVTYVLYKAFQEIDQLITVKVDSDAINQELEKNNLKDFMEVNFGFDPSYKLDDLKDLKLSVKNKSNENPVYIEIDWDKSLITDLENNSRPMIWVNSDDMEEAPKSQDVGKIRPGQNCEFKLSDENIKNALFPVKDLKNAIKNGGKFNLQLLFNFFEPNTGNSRSFYLPCRFTPIKLHWTQAIVLALQPQ
ncbi:MULTISPECIES: hypothetical protein [Moorena]|uniref:Uncharacterized protein n=1 Tax=Moorena producens 3L TaxID=489825 RepID=F4XIZ7_9CYAN|nr:MULTISPECIES: hypothetical protein [Moorena]EGJ35454.1 hypothetical protein LYNGBM3L_04120 [Moorena producens 3L]NEP32986.1 hypothetical protein [Moorena sp. SIO3B2]NEP70041.1 hypothetical protein [Moorena sp. SIO3A5]NEQ09222.1 hypothetical protein [Moorena sp. SIO4E2]NER90446.1 hypothetical protein [Moorena sp. SIO3A2]